MASVAQVLVEAEKSVDFLIYQVLMPDDEIRWRLFHLAILGVLLIALRDAGCQITSLRPLSPKSSGPNYEVRKLQAESCIYSGLKLQASGRTSASRLHLLRLRGNQAMRAVAMAQTCCC